MNDKDWDEKEEFWDSEIGEDDEDRFNGMDGNIDANNDETFGDAAEWNEDEHEELIARDLILSNSHQRGNRTGQNLSNKHGNSTNSTRSDRRDQMESGFPRNLTNNSRNNTSREHQGFAFHAASLEPDTSRNSNWAAPRLSSNDEIQALIRQRLAQEQPRSSTSNEIPWQDSSEASQRLHILQLQHQVQEQLRSLSAEPPIGLLSPQSRLLLEEQARLQLLNDQSQLFNHRLQMPSQQQQQAPTRLLTQTELVNSDTNFSSPQKSVSQPKVLTVDELERQFRKTNMNTSPPQAPKLSKAGPEPSRRAGWSPFGSKDLFNTDDSNPMSNPLLDPTLMQHVQSQTLTLEQHRLILEQQQKFLQRQQLQHLALFKQQQLQQHNRQQHQLNQHRQIQQQQQLQQQQQNTDSGLISSSAQCFTVEELERQMLANRGNKTEEPETQVVNLIRLAPEKPARHELAPKQQSDDSRHRNFQERRNGDRHDGKFDRHNNHRDYNEARDHHRRDNKNHRDHFKHHKKEPKIVPPQVQLGVIEQAKRMQPITPMHPDEFLQDRVPTTGDGFRFSRHSTVANAKADHDGVLTDKERDWLTRIQEKIQADYDDNINQDYYYLMYFNRSSMSGEATQKPSGPGVFDRRFIPRERLLYNSGV